MWLAIDLIRGFLAGHGREARHFSRIPYPPQPVALVSGRFLSLQNQRIYCRDATQYFIFCINVIIHAVVLDKFDSGDPRSVALAARAELCDAEIAALPIGIAGTVFDIQLISNLLHYARG